MHAASHASFRGIAVMKILCSVLLAGIAATGVAAAEPTPTVAVVRVAKPWYAPRSAVVGKMRETLAQYAQLPGLAFKAFSIERTSGDYGGLYYWRDAAAAGAWFNAAWFERVKKERGVNGRVTFYDAPLSIDNTPGGTRFDDGATAQAAPAIDRMLPLADTGNAGPAGRTNSSSVATLVLIGTPAGVSREQIVAGFHQAAPAHRAIAGLLRKHFIIGDNGASFGGLYLWKDEASAKAWFNAAWHENVRQRYGQAATIDWFDTPILLPTRDAANLPLASVMMTAPTP
jgi:heme-degrading monooxygenase HmoA